MSYEHLPFRVTLTKPDASTMDITDRITNDGVVTIDESCEEGIGELRHGDMTIVLNDWDSEIAILFASVDPEDRYEILVERRTSDTDATWMKVFVGVLDFPWSVETDGKKLTTTFRVFSYSKVLENTDAATIKRTFDGTIIGTVDADSDVITLTTGTTSNMKRGDRITLSDEEQTIKTVDSSTQITTVGTFRAAHATQPISVLTPYYRNKSLSYLVDALFDAAGIATNTIDMDYVISTIPFLTGFSDEGIQTSDLQSMTPYSGNLAAWVAGKRYEATAPDGGFGAGTTQTAKADWTRYLASAPAALRDGDTSTQVGYDHTNSYIYTAEFYNSGSPLYHWYLKLYRDGVAVSTIDDYGDTEDYNFDGWLVFGVDYDPAQNRVWVSYAREPIGVNTPYTKYYSVSGGTWTQVSTTAADLCAVPTENRMLAHEADNKVLRLYAVASPSTGDPTLEYPDGEPLIKTVHVLGGYIVGIVRKGDYDYLCLWDKTNRDIEVFASIGPNALTPTPRICNWTYSSNATCVLAAGGALWILSTKFLGTIPYADFSDMSCQTGLKELAIASGAFVYVDLSKVGKFISRFSTTPIFNATTFTLGDYYEKKIRWIWSNYRNRIEITGQALEDGEDVKQIVGSNAYSSRSASISSAFIQSNSQANAMALMYHKYFSQVREEWELLIPEPSGKMVHILDTFYSAYQVLSVQSDLKRRVQRIVWVELL